MIDVNGLAAHMREKHDMSLSFYLVLPGHAAEHYVANVRGLRDNRFSFETGKTPEDALAAVALNYGFTVPGLDGIRSRDAELLARWHHAIG